MRFHGVLLRLISIAVLVVPVSPLLAESGLTADPSIDFSTYSSYAWLPLTPGAGKTVELRNPTAHKLIQDAINQDLSSKGFSITRGTPDFYVTYEVHREAGGKNLSTTGYSIPTHFGDRADLMPHVAGTLMVGLIDAQERRLVWRGWTTGAFSRAELLDFRTVESKIEALVVEILSRFPPLPEYE
ncbi:MAG: DUF4136 domain-containing protein [Acidobacteria bacterium]|nr:DUF4136 domain-containing protein [Acidobacteriota bacterium]